MFPTVPAGKKVTILFNDPSDNSTEGAVPVPSGGVPLILEEDIQLSFSSSFSPLYNGGGKGLEALAAVGRELLSGRGGALGAIGENLTGGQFKHFGFQVWEGTQPVTFNATFGFYIGQQEEFDAYREVYKPAMELTKLCLPRVTSIGSLIAPGPSMLSFLQGEGEEKQKYYSISVQISKFFTIDSAIVTKAQPIFSNEVDEDGYPIWAKVSMDFSSVETANTTMIDDNLVSEERRPWERG